MKVVHPIRNRDQLDRCFEIARSNVVHYLLWLVGCNTALRISAVLRLRVKDVRHQEYVRTVAKKTGKDTQLLVNPAVRREINRMTVGMHPDDFLFKSRQRAYQIINKICRAAGVQDLAKDHTLRKTFGYGTANRPAT